MKKLILNQDRTDLTQPLNANSSDVVLYFTKNKLYFNVLFGVISNYGKIWIFK